MYLLLIKGFNVLFLLHHNTVLIVCLGSGTKTAWLGLADLF